ncbi:TPA: hypothetical protein N2G38_004491 [Salmonella enterica]|nr:hypothetical protein [Salmonella enterica]
MLISNKSYLDKSVEKPLTFSDLKECHLELFSTCREFRSKLRAMAQQLLNEYIQSLSLPADNWTDCKGEARPYVETGVWASRDEYDFKPAPIAELQVNDYSYELKFVVSTVLNDHPVTGGFSHGVNIILWYEKDILNVLVGSGENATRFYVSPQDNFHEVTSAIKLMIQLDMDSTRPGR